jgi:outer membrane lipoprotein-sorting protein
MKKIIVALVLVFSIIVSAQQKDPKKILDAVRQKFSKVNDYKADASIKLDMSFIKIPDMNAKVYFKKPDKMKVEATGFAMLPKQGVRFSPADLLKGDFSTLYVKSETLNNRKVDVIKTIPKSDTSEIILSTLWIDSKENVILKVETTRKKGGTTQIELSYDNFEYGLPSQIKLSFNFGDVQMPTMPSNHSDPDDNANNKDKKGHGMRGDVQLKGSVIMSYKNYQINKGIADSFFDEKEKEKKKTMD